MEQGFPATYTTTTTTTTTTASAIYLDLGYLKRADGIIKCVEMVLDLLGFICITSTLLRYDSRGTWFNTVAMGAFWYTGIILMFYIFHVIDRLSVIPWAKIEFFFCALWAFFYLIAAALAADYGWNEAFAAASFFGFCAMILYAYEAFTKFNLIKSGQVTVVVKPNNEPMRAGY